MQINLHDAYDSQGKIKESHSQLIEGHKHQISLLPNLELIEQHLICHQESVLTEHAAYGLYFTMAGSAPIKTMDDVESLSVCYVPRDITGHFLIAQKEEKSLIQIRITPQHLANVLGENEDQVITYFDQLFDSLKQENGALTLPITEVNRPVCQAILNNTGQNLSLTGHTYACVLVLIEQLKMLKHLSTCSDCQSKIFQAQNLLEAPDETSLQIHTLAHRVGLNKEALSIGFQYIVGESITHYCARSRIQYAAAKLRKNPDAKMDIIANIGLSESQFEAAFIQHFGVNSQQYAQIH